MSLQTTISEVSSYEGKYPDCKKYDLRLIHEFAMGIDNISDGRVVCDALIATAFLHFPIYTQE
jgi:hypothetical protein